ncbi:50S ribosomal protein L24 [Candidatus Kaiserbacteria bacterium RIFCSPHIGHO2_02_FULL_55_20]|uniref:Large ribosomal subunit protein uL24 n=1 Tax=Candidatus Kaiserbacteria bacterium RIFCSPHIGHO2_02_FULL_55_20 TaxID=1798497 RepID=A0A1F6DX05_9BACT|nr:MAG: 50S ribosomal protein L24 [Candidatus Kaiserbacteria bacterium RIFCSPHIGHO2_01_FULL_55_37]OGG65964.1 MAG: 50S ribosomal protein L24 [Candidatus Kaiserbacteria bacterium RIFCSPHIGHO2_02_FULL_55_20]
MKLKKGDKVLVIAGKNKGQSGAIVRVLTASNKVLLDGINLVKRHRKPSAQNRKGQIVDKPMPIHASNVMLMDPKTGKPTRIKIVRDADGSRERVAVKSGETLK